MSYESGRSCCCNNSPAAADAVCAVCAVVAAGALVDDICSCKLLYGHALVNEGSICLTHIF